MLIDQLALGNKKTPNFWTTSPIGPDSFFILGPGVLADNLRGLAARERLAELTCRHYTTSGEATGAAIFERFVKIR